MAYKSEGGEQTGSERVNRRTDFPIIQTIKVLSTLLRCKYNRQCIQNPPYMSHQSPSHPNSTQRSIPNLFHHSSFTSAPRPTQLFFAWVQPAQDPLQANLSPKPPSLSSHHKCPHSILFLILTSLPSLPTSSTIRALHGGVRSRSAGLWVMAAGCSVLEGRKQGVRNRKEESELMEE